MLNQGRTNYSLHQPSEKYSLYVYFTKRYKKFETKEKKCL